MKEPRQFASEGERLYWQVQRKVDLIGRRRMRRWLQDKDTILEGTGNLAKIEIIKIFDRLLAERNSPTSTAG